MDDWKIALFKKENRGAELEIKALSSSIAKETYDKLCERIGVHSVSNTYRSLYEYLQQEGKHVKDCNALSSDFEIAALLEPYHLTRNNDIIIIWDDVETIEMDSMSYETFINHFFDIWFPIAEDIIFFNDTLKFVYLVRHDGVIFKMPLSL